MSKVRASAWALSIGVLAVALAVTLARAVQAADYVFVALLLCSIALVAVLAGLLAEVAPATGAAGGVVAAVVVAVVLGMTIAIAPLAPGAQRPGFHDLLWKPLFALLGFIALCAGVGWLGMRLGLRLARRKR
jgi:hypothetical protein